MIGESDAFKVAAMQGRLAFLDSGTGPARLVIYGSTRPAAGAAVGVQESSSPLAVIDLSKPAGTVSAAGVLTLIVPREGLILISGTPTWARMLNGAGELAFDADVGTEVILSQAQLYAGGTVRLVSAVLG